jgi:hypothetical protein
MQELQQTVRDPAMRTVCEKQLIKMRPQLINSQLSSEQPDMALTYQGTNLTDMQNQLMHTKYSFNLQALKGMGQTGRRTSPKNSDYIKQSILLSGGKSARRF